MPLLPPYNDKEFLRTLLDMALQYSRTTGAHALAARLGSMGNLTAYIRALEHRPDLGDPKDGPRIGDLISQRVRIPAIDPNCVERTVMFLGLAILLAPERNYTAATLMLDEGLHTFPIEITAYSARPIILDPQVMPLRNVMTATVYEISDTSPLADSQLVPWYVSLARNAAISRNLEKCYEEATQALRKALITGTSIEDPEQLDCLIAITEEDAQLFGPLGKVAHDRVHQSIRNLSISLDTKAVSKYLDKIMTKVEPVAGDVVKAALITQFGPAAAIALYGKDIGLDKIAHELTTSDGKSGQKPVTSTKANKNAKSTKEENKRRMRRMSLAYLKNRT